MIILTRIPGESSYPQSPGGTAPQEETERKTGAT